MSEVWWGRERRVKADAVVVDRVATPEMLPADRVRLLAQFDRRAPAYTPEWLNRRPADDAGAALRQLFGEQLETVVRRLDRWPENALIDFLTLTGANALPATPAEVLLEFHVSDDAQQSLLIAAGFQAGARLPGVDQLVVFETALSFYAAPGKTGELFTADGAHYDAVDPGTPFTPFGDARSTGAALVIGLTGTAAPSQTLTLGIGVAAPDGGRAPIAVRDGLPVTEPATPSLIWEIFDGGALVPLEISRDETDGLMRSGLVELVLPQRWRPGPPPGLTGAKSIRFLRVRIDYGRFARPPILTYVTVNMTRALGARTVLDEVPAAVPDSDGRRLQLDQTPVVAGSLILETEDGVLHLADASGGASQSGRTRWFATPDLAVHGPDDAVFEIDLVSGELTFGDGLHGRALPDGYRNVHAVSYLAQSVFDGRVEVDAVSTALTSVEFLGKVGNPQRATGGGARETDAQAIRRGPLELRTRNRAVTSADYALLALRAQGAQVARAYAVPGLHPQYPGNPIPGVVAVFVVPPDDGTGAPVPDEETLRAVASWLSRSAAPAGVSIVAAAPRYQNVRVDTGIIVEPGVDTGATVLAVLQTLDRYLHPLTGGEAGDGWPFGGIIEYVPLLRRITLVAGVHAVPRLNLELDGIRAPSCADVPVLPNALLWPSGHQVFVVDEGALS